MQMGFFDDFLLEINETISVRMKFAIESGNCGGGFYRSNSNND
ncbi:MAG: hypothetical protein Ct9H90mP23_1200 [Methanobacteriota archaeon]|nr:MAG: hypothetical protein Ct9H90mP23_1200 [Euryarchaeota archaeon]